MTPTTINIAPEEAATWALEFLKTAHFVGADFDRFGVVRAFLSALASRELQVAPKTPPATVPDQAPESSSVSPLVTRPQNRPQ
jgi:hypothetical protein